MLFVIVLATFGINIPLNRDNDAGTPPASPTSPTSATSSKAPWVAADVRTLLSTAALAALARALLLHGRSTAAERTTERGNSRPSPQARTIR